jgi:hypothetical protein
MVSRKHLTIVSILAMVALMTPCLAGPAAIRVSCTQNNHLVHREDVPRESLDQRRADISDRFPSAFCVFLEVASEDAVSVGQPARAINSNGPDTDLITALAAITNKITPDRIGEVVPADFSQRFGDVQTKKEAKSKIGLAIGIYDEVPLSTVLAHWRVAAAETTWLSRMTPTVSTEGAITMLSLDGVQDDDVGNVCKELEDRGMKCLAAY